MIVECCSHPFLPPAFIVLSITYAASGSRILDTARPSTGLELGVADVARNIWKRVKHLVDIDYKPFAPNIVL